MANVVWDLDGVCVDLIKYLKREGEPFFKKKNISMIDSNTDNIKDMFGCSEEEERAFWSHNLNLITYSKFEPIRPGIKETMQALHNNGDRNIICSARAKCIEQSIIGNIIRNCVESWIRKNELPIDEIHYVDYKNSAKEKLEICRKVDALAIIEDDCENMRFISQEFPTIRYTTPSNRNVVGKNIIPAYNPDDIYLEIARLKNPEKYGDFRFLPREERELLSYEEVELYYNTYRKIMREMPNDWEKRKGQELKYNNLFGMMDTIHSAVAPKATIVNPEMLEKIKQAAGTGKTFIIASHTTLDDIQQVEKIIGEMSYFLVKKEFSKYPIVGNFLESIGCQYVQRDDEESRKYANSQLTKLLLANKNLIILPEGTRNKTEAPIRKFEKGAFTISQRAGHEVVPVILKRKQFPEKHVYIKFGEPRMIGIHENISTVISEIEQETIDALQQLDDYGSENKTPSKIIQKVKKY